MLKIFLQKYFNSINLNKEKGKNLTKTSPLPLVSVVIPNYNRVVELERALNSVLAQDYINLEIIVIDDFSPAIDEIKKMLLKFDANDIVFIEHESNLGGGAARNTGILAAKGKYIAFLDSDDTWEKSKITMQVLEAEKYTSEVLIYTKSKVINNKGSKEKPTRGIGTNELISEYLFVNNGFIPTPSIFINTEAAKKCLFNESLPRHQDYDFLFKVEQNNIKIVFIDEALTHVIWTSTAPKKDWTSEFSVEFINKYRKQMTNKSYAYAFFIMVVSQTYAAESKKKSFKYFIENITIVKELKMISILKYLIKLLIYRT